MEYKYNLRDNIGDKRDFFSSLKKKIGGITPLLEGLSRNIVTFYTRTFIVNVDFT